MSCIIPEQSIYKLMELSVSLSQGMLGATHSFLLRSMPDVSLPQQ